MKLFQKPSSVYSFNMRLSISGNVYVQNTRLYIIDFNLIKTVHDIPCDLQNLSKKVCKREARHRSCPFRKRSLPFLRHLENFCPFIESVFIKKKENGNSGSNPDLSYP